MNENKEPFLDPVFLCKLIVGIGEVAQITGIPIRQIRYWEDKGIIKSLTEEEGKNRRYDYVNIRKMLMIKLLLDEGFTLDSAAQKVQERILFFEDTFKKLQEAATESRA
ncbi:MerR family transcriptional regulator [soil metagenome]